MKAYSEMLKNALLSLMLVLTVLSTACGGGGGGGGGGDVSTPTVTANDAATEAPVDVIEEVDELNEELRALVAEQSLAVVLERELPFIDEPLPQLGKLLFFSKSLGGDLDSACVSCHHPSLGGADGLSLSVGVGALNPDLLGVGREDADAIPTVPRNAPTIFNSGFWDKGLFADSRIESLGQEPAENGEASGISSPDSSFGVADVNAGSNLVAAQARFPVTSSDEMRGNTFEAGNSNDDVRNHLAARIGDYGVGAGELPPSTWLSEFQAAFSSSASAEDLITFENIALAIGEYERSMVFTNNPWNNYLDGDDSALSNEQKQGAIAFFTSVDDGGAGCSSCHSGELLSDEGHHALGFPQIGSGKGDGSGDDFGRERVTGDTNDRYRFRTPSLLNIAVTAPYGHAGSYTSLREVLRHYANPQQTSDNFFDMGGWCQLPQFFTVVNCDSLYPDARDNTNLALQKLNDDIDRDQTPFRRTPAVANNTDQLLAFLQALTDPCVEDRECLAEWIADNTNTGPDAQQLNATDNSGSLL